MTFTRPAIHVYQELVSTSVSTASPFFELCLVGPSYQVVKEAQASNYSAETAYTSAFVNKTSGTTVKTDSLVMTMKEAKAKIWPEGATLKNAVTVDNTGAVTKMVVPLADQETKKFSTAGVAVGDIVYISYTVDAVTTSFTSYVQEVNVDGVTVTLKRNLVSPAEGATISASIERAIATSLAVDTSLFTVSEANEHDIEQKTAASVVTTVGGVSRIVTSAKVYLSYKALRTYLSGDFVDITTSSDVVANLGAADVDNPLATACAVVLGNTSVSFKVLPIETDDNEGYIKALDILSTTEKVYAIVPLTQDKTVVSAYAAHCTAQSLPEKSRWRICYANLAMPTTKVLVETNDGTLAKGATAAGDNPATNYVKDIANGAFVTNAVVVGDFIDVYTTGATPTYQYSLKVMNVQNDTVVETYVDRYVKTDEGYTPDTTTPTQVIAVDTEVQYEVCRVLSTAGIAEEMVSIAASFANKRLRLVEPDTVLMTINGIDYIMPGYYLCAAYGAMRAGLPPHQGFTNLGVGGIKRIYRSNKMFKDTQLDEMAGGGIFWVVQDSVDAQPYCIYQTTTDTTQLETIEDSVVATIDYCSKYYKDNLKAVIGKFNVNNISVKYVTTVINDITDKLTRATYPYIGSVLISGTLKSVETKADKIIPTVTIEVPFPVNAVDLYLEV